MIAKRTILTALFSISIGFTAGAAPSPEFGKIELLRDEWGVPHIFSDTDAGAFYGVGYVQAEDRAFQMYYSLRIIQGRVSEILGDVPANRRDFSTFDHDKKFRTLGFYRAANRLVGKLDAETVKLLQAFSDGVNDYVAENRTKLLYLFDELGLEPEPWTPADCLASWWHLGNFFAGDGLRDVMQYHNRKNGARPQPAAKEGARPAMRDSMEALAQRAANFKPPVDDAAAVVQEEDISPEWIQKVQNFLQQKSLSFTKDNPSGEVNPKYSHAWVVGGQATTTGGAVLVSDPQTPVRNPSLLYEYHFQGKTFNARGAGVPGSPIILIGWTDRVAWGLTALGADQADMFLLKTDADHPNQYFFDGQWRDMAITKETIKVKGASPQTLTVKETHFGPVVTTIAYDMRPGEEAALKRIPLCQTDNDTIQGAVAMMRARDVKEFSKAIEGWSFPSANIVFGDAQGNIAYWVLAAIPMRSPLALDGENAAHDGSDSKYDWLGTMPYDLLPHVVNPKRGYLLSANHRPIGSFYPTLLGISTGSTGDTSRSWRLRERLQEKKTFTPEEVLAIHYDCVNAPKREILHLGYHMRDVLKAHLSEASLNALAYLEEWYKNGAQSDMAVKGTELVNLLSTFFRMTATELAFVHGGGETGLTRFLKSTQSRIQKNPQADLDDMEKGWIDETLKSAWQSAIAKYGSDPQKWHEAALREAQQETLGYFVSLDNFSALDPQKIVKVPYLTCLDGGTIHSQKAQSYTQWVPMNDIDSAKSLLPIGPSERPGDPLRLSAYEMWSKGELHPAPITRQAVEKYAKNARILSKSN
ncbi:MAG: penicillin acylase family protein [Candidatus Omnitrophota bacterium]